MEPTSPNERRRAVGRGIASESAGIEYVLGCRGMIAAVGLAITNTMCACAREYGEGWPVEVLSGSAFVNRKISDRRPIAA